MEPFIVSLVSALAAGAIAAAKDTATQAVKDAYDRVREYIKDRYAKVRLDDLEEEPHSKGQQLVVQEKLENAGAEDDPALPKLVANLIEALKAQAPDVVKTVGVDLEGIRAAVHLSISERGPVRAANECWSMDFLSDQLFDGRNTKCPIF
jgi:hypothetical protein